MRWGRTTIPVVVALGLTAGCSSGTSLNGEEKKSSTQVVTDARVALKAAKTVHVTGTQKGTGEDAGSDFVMDLYYLNGTGGYGSVTVSGKRLDIVRIGNDVYIKDDSDVTGSAASTGKFQKLSATSGTGKSVGDIANLGSFADNVITSDKTLQPGVVKGTTDGAKAVVLTDSDGPAKLYVANTGSPVPLAIEGPDPSTGKLTFSDYNKKVEVTAPTNVAS
ncbi:MAG: hypothetical protein ACQSGP_17130 [Frankia sp.]